MAVAFPTLSGALHEAFFAPIRAEFTRTRDGLLCVRGGDTLLLQGEPRLLASIRLRNSYVDPVSLLQVDLLRRWRAGNRADDELLCALVACVDACPGSAECRQGGRWGAHAYHLDI